MIYTDLGNESSIISFVFKRSLHHYITKSMLLIYFFTIGRTTLTFRQSETNQLIIFKPQFVFLFDEYVLCGSKGFKFYIAPFA